jgi:RNA polymerase sigma-70 factor (ECF subfamily)
MSTDHTTSPAPSSAELLAQAQRGELTAMGELMELEREYLLEMARRRIPASLQGRMSPSDAVQETLLSAHQHFEQFHGASPQEFSVWLWTILLNTIRDFVSDFQESRKRQSSREVPLDTVPAAKRGAALQVQGLSACDLLIEQETREAMLRSIGLLPETYQQVLGLRLNDDLRFEAVGAALGISAAAARKLHRRALDAAGALMRAHSIIEKPG